MSKGSTIEKVDPYIWALPIWGECPDVSQGAFEDLFGEVAVKIEVQMDISFF